MKVGSVSIGAGGGGEGNPYLWSSSKILNIQPPVVLSYLTFHYSTLAYPQVHSFHYSVHTTLNCYQVVKLSLTPLHRQYFSFQIQNKMKTIKELEKEIKDCFTECKKLKKSLEEHKYKKEVKRLDLLKMCKRYLETSPRQDFVVGEKQRITKLIESYEDKNRYDYWLKNDYPHIMEKVAGKPEQVYKKETGILDLKKNLKTLEYILST